MTRSVPHPGPAYTVVYDGDCKVCQRSVSALAKWDTSHVLEMIASQSPGVAQRFPWIPARAYEDSIQVVRVADNKTWQGAAAVEELMKVVPRGKSVAWIFAIPFARPIAERFYRWFARNRFRFGCSEHCEVH